MGSLVILKMIWKLLFYEAFINIPVVGLMFSYITLNKKSSNIQKILLKLGSKANSTLQRLISLYLHCSSTHLFERLITFYSTKVFLSFLPFPMKYSISVIFEMIKSYKVLTLSLSSLSSKIILRRIFLWLCYTEVSY